MKPVGEQLNTLGVFGKLGLEPSSIRRHFTVKSIGKETPFDSLFDADQKTREGNFVGLRQIKESLWWLK